MPPRPARPIPPTSRYSKRRSTKGCSVVFKQLVIRAFWADFDLRDRPPVYKTAALPIEHSGVLRRVKEPFLTGEPGPAPESTGESRKPSNRCFGTNAVYRA